MANYNCVTRTNYFRVTDEIKYAELFERLTTDGDTVSDFTKEVKGVTLHGFGAYSSISYKTDNDDDCEGDINVFLEALMPLLPPGESLILTEIGHEKLRYLSGFGAIVTHDKIRWLSLSNTLIEIAREMLGDPEWCTEMCY